MNEGDRKSVVKQELYDAISFFIERQHLVAQAMLDLGLDLKEVDRYGPVAWASSVKESIANWAEPDSEDTQVKEILEVVRRVQVRQVAQSGIWRDSDNNEWKYFLHGKGCLLTHSHTHEKTIGIARTFCHLTRIFLWIIWSGNLPRLSEKIT